MARFEGQEISSWTRTRRLNYIASCFNITFIVMCFHVIYQKLVCHYRLQTPRRRLLILGVFNLGS